MAEEGAEEDEDEWEGDPDQELQRKAGPHLRVGPLVGCGDTCLGLGRAWLSSCVHSTRKCTWRVLRPCSFCVPLPRWCCSHLTHGKPELWEVMWPVPVGSWWLCHESHWSFDFSLAFPSPCPGVVVSMGPARTDLALEAFSQPRYDDMRQPPSSSPPAWGLEELRQPQLSDFHWEVSSLSGSQVGFGRKHCLPRSLTQKTNSHEQGNSCVCLFRTAA